MKYYSEDLRKFYDTEKELRAAEEEAKNEKLMKEKKDEELRQARKARADEVEAARKKLEAAQKEYKDVLTKFCKDYSAYHYSINVDDIPKFFNSFFDIF